LAFDLLYHPYPSNRTPVFDNKGMVATSQLLAAQAGFEILKNGGNTAIAQALARKGHNVQIAVDVVSFGRGQIIWRD
jgi:hypothetical protein